MNDRELLERAAKAAGIEVRWHIGPSGGHFLTRTQAGNTRAWRPLDDDGDALRLAVKLGLVVEVVRGDRGRCFVYAVRKDVGIEEEGTADPYAATRRAIVRAAAELEDQSAKG